MSCPVPVGDYVAHFDPVLDHHRAWLLAVLEWLEAQAPGPGGGWAALAAVKHRAGGGRWRGSRSPHRGQ
jgi:hypothetical protein